MRDVKASATFYESRCGLSRTPSLLPGAVVFATAPIPFAVRETARPSHEMQDGVADADQTSFEIGQLVREE